jgi:glyoxylase-like metal-dependent hydrolase (beta-lactamase superfamily II)
MRIHHLDCAPMAPPGARLVHGEGSLFSAGRMVGHCLLVEHADGLVLIDSGFGLSDIEAPYARVGAPFLWMNRPRLRPEDTAVRQIAALGFRASDVRRVILTHLDVDHAGGIADFPDAEVHVTVEELNAALKPRSLVERGRYRKPQWAHGPRWVTHTADGESWNGFASVRAIAGHDDLLLVPLSGHTRGHTAVALRTGSGWLLHAGDAYFCRSELDSPRRCPPALEWVQRLDDIDREARLANQARLRTLAQSRTVEIFCAHDAAELDRYACAPAATTVG